MLDYDKILQKKLDELEGGAPLETILQDLPAEARELEMLIRLAAAVRDAPHPAPADAQVSAQRNEVLAAAVRNTRPATRHPAWNWTTAGALLSAAGAMALFIALILVSARFWFSSRDMDTARVEYLDGQVQMATGPASTDWKDIEAGARLRAGSRLRTLGKSNATLVFFEGTHSFVSPNSELTLSQLNGSSGNTLQVKIDQSAGETWNKVTPFNGNSKSLFLVQTPSGVASVRGTSFNVKVSKTGQSHFAVDTGEVRVKNSAKEVTLLAGQATMANPNGEIAAPTYQFAIQGSLLSVDTAQSGTLWTVSGAQIQVTDATEIAGDPQLGDTIEVSGRILEASAWVADTIEPGSNDGQEAIYTGRLEKNEGERWVISGRTVEVTPQTELDAGLAANNPVKVTYNIIDDDGSWLALKIKTLVEQPEPSAAAPTTNATTGNTAAAQCTGVDQHPTGMQIAQRYRTSQEEIMGWFCQHYGFGEIDLAYSLSRQAQPPVAVEEIFAMRASGMGWGDIKKAVLSSGNTQDKAGDIDSGSDAQDDNGKGKYQDKDKDQNQDKDQGKDKDKKDK